MYKGLYLSCLNTPISPRHCYLKILLMEAMTLLVSLFHNTLFFITNAIMKFNWSHYMYPIYSLYHTMHPSVVQLIA